MSVILRKRKLADGKLSLFLDIHVNGARTKEYLQIYINPKPKDVTEKELNKINMATAESMRAKREISIHADEYQMLPAFKRDAKFSEYFNKFSEEALKKGDRIALAAYTHFQAFVGSKTVTFKQVTEQLAEGYKKYLLGLPDLKGGTAAAYFNAFKTVIRNAYKQKIIRDNPVMSISIPNKKAIYKDVLTMDEIVKLNNTDCRSEDVKRGFIFSCLTGLRNCDIRRLTWGDVKQTKEGLMIEIKQAKTGTELKGNLNADAVQIIGKRGLNKNLIFNFPSRSVVHAQLQKWATKAGLSKHLSYHVARHSFATNLVYYGTDVKTTSQLLGHTSMAYTTLYLHISDSMKQDAVNKLPSLKTN